MNLNETNEEVFSENIDPIAAEESLFEFDSIEQISSTNDTALALEEEYTPKLFSEITAESLESNSLETEEHKLFDQENNQENNQEDDFEIPAFLRRQKF